MDPKYAEYVKYIDPVTVTLVRNALDSLLPVRMLACLSEFSVEYKPQRKIVRLSRPSVMIREVGLVSPEGKVDFDEFNTIFIVWYWSIANRQFGHRNLNSTSIGYHIVGPIEDRSIDIRITQPFVSDLATLDHLFIDENGLNYSGIGVLQMGDGLVLINDPRIIDTEKDEFFSSNEIPYSGFMMANRPIGLQTALDVYLSRTDNVPNWTSVIPVFNKKIGRVVYFNPEVLTEDYTIRYKVGKTVVGDYKTSNKKAILSTMIGRLKI